MATITVNDIKRALEEIEEKIQEAQTVMNYHNNTKDDQKSMSDCLDNLFDARTAIYDLAYNRSVKSQAFIDAVTTIAGAAKDLKDVASNMKSATDFINSLATFLTAVGGALPVLKGK